MELEEFKYEDLFGNKMEVSILEYGDRKVVIDMLRKLDKGEYTLILCVPYHAKAYDIMKKLSIIIVDELDFSGLVIQADADGAVQLIAYFQLEEWQKVKVQDIITSVAALQLNLKTSKTQK